MADPAFAGPLASAGARAAARPAGATVLAAAAPALWCVLLAAFSVALQGFHFGNNNNLFHIPIVLRWYDLPQFAHDPFIQSLRRYSTPVFPALSLVSTEADIRTVFLVCQLITRSLTFWALLQLFLSVGLELLEAAAAVAAVALAAVVYGVSAVGGDELLVSVFTHTALAQACALLAIAWILRGWPIRAALAAAAAFDINFMVGAWCLAPLAAVALFDLRGAAAERLRALALSAALFALAVAPLVVWVVGTQRFQPIRFDYAAYLANYYGHHFFIACSTWGERIALLLQVAAGLGAAAALPRRRIAAALALAAMVALFAVGVVVGQVSHSRMLLNLHLLRSDGLTGWMCAAFTAAAAVAGLARGRGVQVAFAFLTLASLTLGHWSLAAAGVWLLAAATWWAPPQQRPHAAVARLGLALAAIAAAGLVGGRYSSGDQPAEPAWSEVASWARSHTAPDAVFLTPWSREFVAMAKRRDWVSWKEGATVMWAPETYAAWRARSDEVRRLADAHAALAYACDRGIDYVVFERRGPHRLAGVEAAGPAMFENRDFLVAAPRCAARTSQARAAGA